MIFQKITSLIKQLSPKKIDYMSLNRLRLNLSADSSLPICTPLVQKTREAAEKLQEKLAAGASDSIEVLVNPYGTAPLCALVFFHLDKPCHIAYTVKGTTVAANWHFTFDSNGPEHAVPVFGLYPDADNLVAFELQTGHETLKSFEIHIKTAPLNMDDPDAFPLIRDCCGDIRYLLQLPVSAKPKDILALSNRHFLLKSNRIGIPTEDGLMSTHLYEADLLGRVYRTCYVGSGIAMLLAETEDKHLVLKTKNDNGDDAVVEIDRETGSVLHMIHSMADIPEYPCHDRLPLTKEQLSRTITEDLVSRELEAIPFSTTGWLYGPVLYKGASIGTKATVDAAYLDRTYHIKLCLCGDTLLLSSDMCQIENIVFFKSDRIYQMDFTSLVSDMPERAYTLAIPFTEMYSGTYSILIRFHDGGQEVLTDTITLSRTRSN
jgi:hypothetical protein